MSYVFASELGSGVYDFEGRSLQVYRFTPGHRLREPAGAAPGVRLVSPVTIGFLDFGAGDVLESGLPTHIDSLSVMPGIEFDYAIGDGWRVIPYARAGASVASGGIDGWVYAVGLRTDYLTTVSDWDLDLRQELTFAGVSWRGDVPNDQFLRLRQAAEFRRGVGWRWHAHEIEGGIYGIADLLADPPDSPVSSGAHHSWQFEFGVMLGARPAVRVWRFDAPRIGLGYRLAGSFSGWRLAIAAPF